MNSLARSLNPATGRCVVCDAVFPMTKAGRQYCTWRCRKKMERLREKQRARVEGHVDDGKATFPHVVENPTEAELRQAAQIILASGRLLPDPFVFHGPVARAWTPPPGVVMEAVEHGCTMMRPADVVEMARAGASVPAIEPPKRESILDKAFGVGWKERALEAAMTPVGASAEPKPAEDATPTQAAPPSVSLPDVTLEAGTPVVTDEFQEIEGDELPDHLK